MVTLKIETPQHRAEFADEKWKEQYFNGEWDSYKFWKQQPDEIYIRLVEECSKPSVCPQSVNDIIGNNSWTNVECGLCGRNYNEDGIPFVLIVSTEDMEKELRICETCIKSFEDRIKLWKAIGR